MQSLEEVGREADTVRSEIEQLCVRGLASSTPAERRRLSSLASEWERLGAGHVASKVLAAVQKADADAKDAPQALLSAYTSLHVFERLLSLEAAADAWARHLAALQEDDEEGEEGSPEQAASPAEAAPPAKDKTSPAPPASPASAPPIEDPKGAVALLSELTRAVEDLVRTGLTSATESTRAKLDASFKEASRRKLLRLGASLRYVNEEVGRFLADDGSFSIRRFAFFLHRSWVIARGMEKGIRDKDARVLSALLSGGGAAPRPVPYVEVVTIGILKRTIVNAYTFDFKLRIVSAKEPDLVGRSLTYSLVFPRKKETGKDLPGEAYLHLPQPQKFMPRILHQGRIVKVTECAVALDDRGGGRLLLGPKSTLTEGDPHSGWEALYRFDPESALDRVRRARPTPLDLAVEMQEEVFVEGAAMTDSPVRTGEGRRIFGLTSPSGLSFDVIIPDGPDGDDLLPKLRSGLKSRDKPLLYGLAYYEFGRVMLLPLSLVSAANAPDLITISQKKFDVSALVGTLKF